MKQLFFLHNGLACMHTGPLDYLLLTRITKECLSYVCMCDKHTKGDANHVGMTLLGFVFDSHHMGITWHDMIGVLNEHHIGVTLIIMVHFVLA